MLTIILLGLSAIGLAGVAAFFSIIGLSEFAAAAATPIMIFGGVLEFSKLIATGFLHYYWKDAPAKLKYSGVFFIASVMLITMMGIYGFISAAHYNQNTPIEAVEQQTARLDEQISLENTQIARNQTRLKQMDAVVDGLIGSEKLSNATTIRDKQKKERAEVESDIKQSYAKINDFEAKKLELKQSISVVTAKLGPVKSVAEFTGIGTNGAVNIFIIMLMIPFDPFAIWLVMATTYAYKQREIRIATAKKETQATLAETLTSISVPHQTLNETAVMVAGSNKRDFTIQEMREEPFEEVHIEEIIEEKNSTDTPVDISTSLISEISELTPQETVIPDVLSPDTVEEVVEEPQEIINHVEDIQHDIIEKLTETIEVIEETLEQEKIMESTLSSEPKINTEITETVTLDNQSNVDTIRNIITEISNKTPFNNEISTVENKIDDAEAAGVPSEFEPDIVTENIVSIIRRNPDVVDDLKKELLDDVPYPVLKELENVLIAFDRIKKEKEVIPDDSKSWLSSITVNNTSPAPKNTKMVMGNENQK